MDIKPYLETFNHYFTLYAIFPAILLVGLYLTWQLRCVQLSQLKNGFCSLIDSNPQHEGNISRFKAISTVLAGNFGTGNISGMAIAISTGGPGALVWMWVMAFFGAAIQFASCHLGISYRTKNRSEEYVGGPMYYLRDGLGFKGLAVGFSLATMAAALTVGNFAQTNSLTLPLQQMGYDPFICSLVIALGVAAVILGGIHRLAGCAAKIVPLKALLYLSTAAYILVTHASDVMPAFKLMFQAAFGWESLGGGLAGYGTLRALTTGFDRGLFATDAGTGIVPMLQASARSEHPVADGIASLVAPFLVMIVCTTTGLVLLVTGAWQHPDLQSTNMVTYAFTQGTGSVLGGYIVIVSLLLFGFTTILAWGYCGEKALEFIVGTKKSQLFRYGYIALLPVGSVMHVDLIWTLADISINAMLLINIIAVSALAGEVIGSSRNYLAELKSVSLN